MIVARGERDLVDVFLVNETNRTGLQVLTCTATNPDGTVAMTASRKVVAAGGDTFGQLLAEGLEVPRRRRAC